MPISPELVKEFHAQVMAAANGDADVAAGLLDGLKAELPKNKNALDDVFDNLYNKLEDIQAQEEMHAAEEQYDGNLEQYAEEAVAHEPALYVAGGNAVLAPEIPEQWQNIDAGGVAPPVQIQPVPNNNHVQDAINQLGQIGVPKKKAVKGVGYQGYPPPDPYITGAPVGSTLQASIGGNPGTRGLMVFYINTGGLAKGEALDLMDKVKEQYRNIELAMRKCQIEVMWLPRSQGSTKVEFFDFS